MNILMFFLLFSLTFSLQAETIDYQFSVTDAPHHLAEVKVTFPQVGTKTLDIKLPVWRSGRYEILDLGKNIRHMKASQNGHNLTVNQLDKNSWRVYLKQPGDLTIDYQVYANQLRERVAHLDDTHAFLDASGVFVYAPALRNDPLTVKMHVPDHWVSRSGMPSKAPHHFMAENYDQLVDSPIESGIHEFDQFTVDGLSYETLIWGKGNHDISNFQTHAEKLHQVAKELWGDFPYQRYLYMIHSGDGLRGATEHVNSTIMQFDRFGFADKKTYHRFLATTAHELIHTWNVKAYRPSGIAPYDYDKENYTDLFWMAEGSTSYYDDLFLMRAGIYQQSEYLNKLSEDLNKYINQPGRLHRSLSEASFNTWQKENSQRNHNANVSIYLHGSMATWFLDYEIRKHSNNKHSFDDLQRQLYQNHRNSDQGYRKDHVLDILTALTNHDFSTLWADHIDGTKPLPISDMLKFYGLSNQENKEPKLWVGLSVKQGMVTTVDHNSPAWKAGISAGDELIGLNGLRIHPHQWTQQLKSLKTGQEVSLLLNRAGVLKNTQMQLGESTTTQIKLKPIKNATKAQRAIFKSWTGHTLSND